MSEHVAGRFERQTARRQNAFVIHELRVAAARRQDDDVLARPVHVAMRGVGVFGVETRSPAGELRAVAPAPIEIDVGRGVERLDQRRGFAQEALGGEDFADRAAGDVGGHDADGGGLQHAFRVRLEFDQNLAGFVVGGGNIVEARHQIGQGLAGDARREQPAANGVRGQMPHERRERHFEIARLESHAVAQQRGAKSGELRGLGAHVRPRSPVALLQKVEFLAGEMR